MTATALILIDIQNDYFPGGAFELDGMEEASQNAAKLLSRFREQKMPIFHIYHENVRPNATFFLPSTDGAKIHNSLAPKSDEPQILKHRPNSFHETDLLKMLQTQKITHLVICGAMSHMCIDASARAAVDLGFTVQIAEDACASRPLVFNDLTIPSSHVHGAFMSALAMSYGEVLTTDTLLANI